MNWIRSFIFVIWLYGSMAMIGLVLWPLVVFNERHVWTALRS